MSRCSSEGSYGYRPGRSAKDAIRKVKEYAEKGYVHAVCLDLSKYFDTLNHNRLLNLLRENVKDERVIQIIKRYLKSGVMEDGVVIATEEGSPQGGNLSPLLANIYLDAFDKEFETGRAMRTLCGRHCPVGEKANEQQRGFLRRALHTWKEN